MPRRLRVRQRDIAATAPCRTSRLPSFAATVATAASLLCAAAGPAVSQDRTEPRWSPYDQDRQQSAAGASAPPQRAEPPAASRRGGASGWTSRGEHEAPPASAPGTAAAAPASGLPLDRKSRAVESVDLTPVMAGDGSSLPYELWQGLDTAAVEQLIASLTIPPRSPALHDLWRRLITSSVAPPSGGKADGHFEALRLEAMYRSGLLDDISAAVEKDASGGESPLVAMLAARSDIGLKRREAGCARARRLGDIRADIPKSLRGEAVLVSGYCAAAAGDAAAAGLLAQLAREEGISASPGLAALDEVSLGGKPVAPKLAKGQRLTLIDYRILELSGAAPAPAEVIAQASPALLVAIARDGDAPVALRLQAAEAAARVNAITPDQLADAYRAGAMGDGAAQPGNNDSVERRAALYVVANAERTPFKKVRLIRSFLDSAQRAGLQMPALVLVARLTHDVGLAPEIGWFAETAIEANLAAGDYAKARTWLNFAASADAATPGGAPGAGGRGSLSHWAALIDIADPAYPDARGGSLAAVERMALSGRFSSDLLHRLATVLDALDYQVPIPLWEAASRTPQPATGHLPATGVLSQLQQAAAKKEFGRTVLLAMQTLGPDGADRAHMIALGDAIRALRRAGLDKDARRLALEALISSWPRATSS